ncbi:MAG: DUF1223 domain-containing protein [Steroidobacteraceae bacterium]
MLCLALLQARAWASPTVVELFTSQGCNSCPPAEAYLGELAQRSDVLALSYHVDYWNYLGWKDPHALPVATERQRAYAKQLRLRTVFTPQMIIDGRTSLVGSDRRRVETRLGQGRELNLPVSVILEQDELVVLLGPDQSPAPADTLLIPYRRTAHSFIAAGENRGLRLKEFNVVREVRNVGRTSAQSRRLSVAIDSIPPDATDVAVLLQRPLQGEIVGAAQVQVGSPRSR